MTKIHCLVTGCVRGKAGSRGLRRYLVDDWCADALPVNTFLVQDQGALCLFDAGQTARAARPGWFPRWQPFFRLSRFELGPHDEVAPQLRSIGIDPRHVRRVVLSHLHTDHVGGLDAFGHAEVVVSRTEWEAATGLRGRIRGYLPQYWPAGLEPTLVDFHGNAVGPFTSSFDLTGEGRLLLVPAPGHTKGHTALIVRDHPRTWLLAGDLAHTAEEVAEVAPAIAAWCRDEHVRVLTAHDPEACLVAGTL